MKALCSFCDNEVQFRHIYWEANFRVDSVASLSHDFNPSRLWENGDPLYVANSFYFDHLGPPCPRGFLW